MKILYLSDNRCRGNFGCRATSTALSQIVGQDHIIVGRISGKYTNRDPGPLIVNKKWSTAKYNRLSKMKYKEAVSSFIYLFHRFLGRKNNFFMGKYDFASYDLDEAIDCLMKCFAGNEHIREYDLRQYDFEALVVNGEGSFIFATPAWRESMIITLLMYWAQKMGKKVYFLNAMFSDSSYSKHNDRAIATVAPVLEKCEVVQVREQASYNYAKTYFPHLNNLKILPDALFTWYPLVNDGFKIENGKYFMPFGAESDEGYYCYDYTRPYILICGSSSEEIVWNKEKTKYSYINLVQSLKNSFSSYKIYLIQPCEGDEFLKEVAKETDTVFIPMQTPIVAAAKIIANASLFITGRYHPAIMASLGGTPCVFMDSNSHKTSSLQQLLQYGDGKEFCCVPSEEEIVEIINRSKILLEDETIRDRIKDRAKDLCVEARTIKFLIK